MTTSAKSIFVYVTYIRATPEKVWAALTDPGQAEKFWPGARPEADWKPGGAWRLVFPDGRTADQGEIVEFNPPKKLAIHWRNEFMPDFKAEGWTLCTMEIEPQGQAVKLTVRHSMDREGSKFIQAVSDGWPQIMANLKSFLETGEVVLESMDFGDNRKKD
jgi:uncharacterized protein YndB with AHSA1/START domain